MKIKSFVVLPTSDLVSVKDLAEVLGIKAPGHSRRKLKERSVPVKMVNGKSYLVDLRDLK